MRKVINRFFYLVILFGYSLSWANLPKPPSADIADGSNDWLEIGKVLLFKVIGYAAIAGGSLVLLGVAYSIVSAYHVAQEKQDLGHFFKHLMVGLLVAAITSGLMYVGYTTVQQ